MTEKWATQSGTENYFKWISIDPSKQRRFDDLAVSALGAGTHLGLSDDATDRLYEETLVKAGASGINFFDTAIHYRCQRSEKVLKKVLKDLAARGIMRDQIVVATKGGHLPSEGSENQLDKYVKSHYLDKGVIEAKEILEGSYCMSPSFLEDQIHTSLKNIGIDAIDLYYLQNPEFALFFLGEEKFYAELLKVFVLFEKKVQEKKIRRYGIASWDGFRQKIEQKGTLQLEKILQCAKEAGGEKHHFRAVQIPYNLIMLEAIKIKRQLVGSKKMTLFDAAKETGVFLMASSPLMQSKVGSISRRFFDQLPKEETPMLQSLEFVISTPQIVSAFCGMKRAEHWLENSKILQKPSWEPPIWTQAFKKV